MTGASLNQRQKAAVIVRLLLDDDEASSLARLDSDSQTLVAEEMARMELVDRETRDAIITEFCDRLESVGVTFPGDLDGTLAMLGGRLSEDSTDRLRRLSAMSGKGDPWVRLASQPLKRLIALANSESVELVALMLAKLPVSKASETFSALSRERAHEVAQAISMTGGVSAKALHRVGLVLLQATEAMPRPAIETPAAERMGAILNFAAADLREDVLEGLDRQDADFAGGVRRAIFTFDHIPFRIHGRDVPRLVREVDQAVMLRALSASSGGDAEAAEFILANLSQRMADGLRDEREGLSTPRPAEIEEAMKEVVTIIRRLETEGEVTLIPLATDED